MTRRYEFFRRGVIRPRNPPPAPKAVKLEDITDPREFEFVKAFWAARGKPVPDFDHSHCPDYCPYKERHG